MKMLEQLISDLAGDQIGYLLSTHNPDYPDGAIVTGFCCADNSANDPLGVPLFKVNIGSYGQSCHCCDRILVQAQNGWCELYSKDQIQIKVGDELIHDKWPPGILPAKVAEITDGYVSWAKGRWGRSQIPGILLRLLTKANGWRKV